MSSLQFNLSDSMQCSVKCGMQKGMEIAATSLVNDVVQQLAEKYGQINIEEALEMLDVMMLPKKPTKSKKSKKATKDKKTNEKSKKEDACKLPWCGQVLPNCCQAIQSCSKLYVQCQNDKLEDGDYCKRCQTATNKNGGTPPYGVIQDRFNADYKDKKGAKPIKYGNYMKNNNISREDAEAEAAKLGWVIPPEQFEVMVKRLGRKKKEKVANVDASDTDEDIVAKIAKENKDNGVATDDSSDDDSSDDDEPLGGVVAKKRNSDPSTKEKDAKRACVQEDEHSELGQESMNESGEESGEESD